MRKQTTFVLSFIVMISSFSSTPAVLAYEDTLVLESMQTIDGSLTVIDTDNNRVTARWMADELLMKYQDITLDVPSACVITKNGQTIELNDLEPNDPATVRFDSNWSQSIDAGRTNVEIALVELA